jgi:hypothetical protein
MGGNEYHNGVMAERERVHEIIKTENVCECDDAYLHLIARLLGEN